MQKRLFALVICLANAASAANDRVDCNGNCSGEQIQQIVSATSVLPPQESISQPSAPGKAGYFSPVQESDGFYRPGFSLLNGFYGSGAYTDPEASYNYLNHLATGFQFNPVVDSGMAYFVSEHPGNFVLYQNAATIYSDGLNELQIDAQRQAAAAICSAVGLENSGWNLMAEWDQSGGGWAGAARPSYIGLSRAQAYSRFVDYYLGLAPLPKYLQETANQIGCRKIAQTDYSPNVYTAYALGVDEVWLERGLDELGDHATGIAFIRGAARQNDRRWGIDLSTWRTFSDSVTRFNSAGTLTGGWSPSYLRRIMYASYLNGAHVLNIEPTDYDLPSGQLNPFGTAVKDFGEFSLLRHPDVGRTAVSMAIMIPNQSGFDTKHGLYNQQNGVWYQDIPYSTGDYMLNNLLQVAYPNHNNFGTMPCSFTGAGDYNAFLAGGGDARRCEAMPFTRWGDNLDIITDAAPSTALGQYTTILLGGDVSLTPALRASLQSWVNGGGTLVVNSSQISYEDWSWLGLTLGSTRSGFNSVWLDATSVSKEPRYSYPLVIPISASVLARTQGGDPLITSNNYGQGRVIFTAPFYLQATDQSQLLTVGTNLIDWLFSQNSLALVAGPPIEYVVNQGDGTTVVGLINHSGTVWQGNLNFRKMGKLASALEYVSDTSVELSDGLTTVKLTAQVPPYDLRVYAVRFAPGN